MSIANVMYIYKYLMFFHIKSTHTHECFEIHVNSSDRSLYACTFVYVIVYISGFSGIGYLYIWNLKFLIYLKFLIHHNYCECVSLHMLMYM